LYGKSELIIINHAFTFVAEVKMLLPLITLR
jgi:hypothetical protein